MLSNLSFLKSFAANDAAKISKYVNMFLTGAPQMLEQMKSQLQASDWKGLRTTVHSLKSQVKYMGIASAEELAITIEKHAAEETNLSALPEMVSRLESITNEACTELRDELTRL